MFSTAVWQTTVSISATTAGVRQRGGTHMTAVSQALPRSAARHMSGVHTPSGTHRSALPAEEARPIASEHSSAVRSSTGTQRNAAPSVRTAARQRPASRCAAGTNRSATPLDRTAARRMSGVWRAPGGA
jgi:hypothetical protein